MKKPVAPQTPPPPLKEEVPIDPPPAEEMALSKLMEQERDIIWSSRSQQRALGIFALVAILGIIWLAQPVWIGLLLGTLLAFSIEPFYQRLRRRWKRAEFAALLCSGLATLGVLGAMVGIGYWLVNRTIALAQMSKGAFLSGGWVYEASQRVGKQFSHLMKILRFEPTAWITRLGEQAASLANQATELARTLADATLSALLTMFFLVLTMHFILKQWPNMTKQAEALLPLHPRHSRALLEEFRQVGRNVLLGTVLTGIAQGVLAGIGYFLMGVPEAAFFGALTAVASLVPAVGTLLIWIPIGVYLIVTGHVAGGIVELVYGTTIVVGVSDYIIRPALVGRHGKTPALLMFIALFGGISVFGMIGLILGPVIMTLSIALVRLYIRERSQLIASQSLIHPIDSGDFSS